MSAQEGSDSKYDVILQKLAELKALAEATDQKVGLLHAEKTGKMEAAREEAEAARKVREKQEREEQARKQAEVAKTNKRLAEVEAVKRAREKAEAQKKADQEMIEHGVSPFG